MTDVRLEKMVAWLLRSGVMLAAAVVLGGGICYVLAHAGEQQPTNFHGEPAQYRNLSGIVSAALSGDCAGIIQLGLLLLIATPVVRVALSLAGFALERDRTYTIVTALVLAILVLSLAGKI